MTAAFATEAAVSAFVSTETFELLQPDLVRLLARATDLLDEQLTRAVFTVDDDGLPTDSTIAAALSNACCAQLEFWAEVGEEHDIEGLAGTHVRIGHLDLEHLPPELAPRAARFLCNAGLQSAAVSVTSYAGRCSC